MLQEATADIGGGPHGDVWKGCEFKTMSKIERMLDKFDSDSSDEDLTCEILNCQFPFVHFFHMIVFVSEKAKNKMIFATQFVFYLMVLFVRATNKGKVTHGKTPRVFYIFSTLLHYGVSSWSYVKDLQWVFFTLLFTLYINYSCTIKDSFQNTHTKGTNRKTNGLTSW